MSPSAGCEPSLVNHGDASPLAVDSNVPASFFSRGAGIYLKHIASSSLVFHAKVTTFSFSPLDPWHPPSLPPSLSPAVDAPRVASPPSSGYAIGGHVSNQLQVGFLSLRLLFFAIV
jgi:hypothetical protein